LTIERIISTDTRKTAFEKADRNFVALDADAKLKANTAQEDLIYGTLENGWQGSVQYRRNTIGELVIIGSPYGGTATSGIVVFTLPVGYRPSENRIIQVGGNSLGTIITQVVINADGTVTIRADNTPYQLHFCNNIPI